MRPHIAREEDSAKDTTVYRLVIPNEWFTERASILKTKLLMTWWLVKLIWRAKP